MVRYFERRGVPSSLSAIVLVAVVIGVFGSGLFFLSGPVAHWLEIAPEIGQDLSRKLSSLRSPVEAVVAASEQVENLTEGGSATVQKVVVQQPGLLSRAADNLAGSLAMLGLTIVLLLFLLSSGTLFYEKLISVMPRLSNKKKALRVVYDIESVVSRYLLDDHAHQLRARRARRGRDGGDRHAQSDPVGRCRGHSQFHSLCRRA